MTNANTPAIAPLSAAELDTDTLWEIHGVVKNAGSTRLAHKIADAIAQARLAAQPVEAHSQDFAAWLAREMPAGTVIGDPAWWAPKILRAAFAAPVAAQADTTEPSAGVAAAWALKQIADLDPKNGSIATAVFMAREGLATATSTGEADTTASVSGEARVDEIVTALYRRFKGWSKRGFGPDDVTWCEVKADVLALIAAAAPVSQAVEQPADDAKPDDFARGVIAALGVLASGHGYTHGTVYHDEIMQSVGEATIYAAAEDDDYAWAGLDPQKKPRKRAAMSATKQEGNK